MRNSEYSVIPKNGELLVIAEISSNHNQDLARAKKLIRAAHESGANAVKFQLFEVDKLFAPEVLALSQVHRDRVAWELPRNFVPELSAEAHSVGLLFGCTPFDLDGVEFLTPFIDFFKIASYELLWHDLITACGNTGKPLILSTGMASEAEVSAGLESVGGTACKEFAVLHCVSAYPAPRDETNLRAIARLREKFGVVSGWSDHTRDMEVVSRAVNRWGASIIELHLDLDGTGYEAGVGHSWLPEEMRSLMDLLNEHSDLDGDGVKAPTESELSDVPWRADPSDGLRPLVEIRPMLKNQW